MDQARAGFCDITGQTNERTVLAAVIPANVICGNKVPTLVFKDAQLGVKLKFAWVGIANSFCFDWLTRLVCTTSLNFFILDSIPIPDSGKSLPEILKIAEIVEKYAFLPETRVNGMPPKQRATIEAIVLHLYGLDDSETKLVLSAFPQIDKCQPALPGERKSTVTADYVLSEYYRMAKDLVSQAHHHARVKGALIAGAQGFMPNQFTK